MGNVFYCCRKVSDFIHGKATGDQTEEQSPLLSRENSDLESLSPLKTPSDPLGSSPVLDQDHLLFPDIVLSSNIGALDTEDSVQPFEVLLATRRQARGVRINENGEERGAVNQQSTNVIHKEVKDTGTNQSSSREDEWPLLSSLYLIPLDQPNAALHPNRICTYARETDATFLGVDVNRATCTQYPSHSDHDFSHRDDVRTQTEHHITYKERDEMLDKTAQHLPTENERTWCGKEHQKYPNGAAQKNPNAITEPTCAPSVQNWHLTAQEEQSEDPDVLERPDSEQNVETFEMGVINHVHDQAATSADLLKNKSTHLDSMEKKTSHVEQMETEDHPIRNMEESLMDEDLIWKKKAVERTQWDEQTTLAVSRVEQRAGQSERFTLFVVDKMFLATPNFTGVYLSGICVVLVLRNQAGVCLLVFVLIQI